MSDKIENSKGSTSENKPVSPPAQESNIEPNAPPARELIFVESDSNFSTNSEQPGNHFEE